MTFARPALLLLLALLPWWWWRRARRAGPAATASDTSPVEQVAVSRWPLRVPGALRSAAAACAVIGAAGPSFGGGEVELKREGIAIVLALDISSSMLAEDFAPANRLEVAKQQAIGFVRGREQDRIGLVAFAGEALTQVPLTFDYDVLEQAILDLRIGALEDGTAIGSGLATAVNRLRAAPDTSKVVVILSDGENNRGRIDPRTAAAAAASLGVKVYTIGVGTEGEAPIPTGRGVGGFRYEVLPVRIDEALLTDIAAKTGGRYFRARDAAALAEIFRQIDRLERTTSRVTRYTRRDEATWPFAAATLGFLALELALSATLLVRAP